jgi:hypothetical protein
MTMIRLSGSQLHAARVLVGLSREEVAERAGLCRHSIRNGKRRATLFLARCTGTYAVSWISLSVKVRALAAMACTCSALRSCPAIRRFSMMERRHEPVPTDDRRRRHGDHHCRLALGKSRVQAAEDNPEQIEKEGNDRHLCSPWSAAQFRVPPRKDHGSPGPPVIRKRRSRHASRAGRLLCDALKSRPRLPNSTFR